MMRLSAKKQALIFIIGSAVNLLLFCLTKYTVFPFWTDYTGSLYITALCGPLLGIVSILLHTLLLIILIDGYTALLPMISVLAAAIIIYLFIKDGEKSIHKSLSAAYCTASAAFIINSIIFLCCKAPVGRYQGYTEIFSSACDTFGKLFASLFLSAAITFAELFIAFIVLGICWILTPKREESLTFKK